MKRRVLTIVLIVIAVVALVFVLWRVMNSQSFQFFGGIVSHVETSRKVVALTFDDGPSDKTDDILAVLKDADIKATFFLAGSAMEQYPAETERIVAAGHQIANHTWSHSRLIFRSLSYISSEIENTDAQIRKAGYQGEIQFRPPHGKKLVLLPYYLYKNNRKTILWDLEPNSYPEVNANSANIVKYVVDNVKPGSIILLHVMYDKEGHSIEAIKGIAKELKAQGYEFVPINELLSYNSK